MKNFLGHATDSLSIRGIKRKEGHHHMFKTIGTHTVRIVDKNVSNPFCIRIWECRAKAHDIVDKKKLELIDLVSWC